MITLERILELCCDGTDVKPSQVLAVKQTRKAHIMRIRHYVCYVLRRRLGLTQQAIAVFVGYKDHSSVFHAIEHVEDRMFCNSEYRKYVRNKEVLFDRLFDNQ